MSTDDPQWATEKLRVIEQRLSEAKGWIAKLKAKHHAAALMTGDRRYRTLRSIEKEIEKAEIHKDKLEREREACQQEEKRRQEQDQPVLKPAEDLNRTPGNVPIDHEELMGEWIDQMVNEGKVAADMLRVAKKPEEVREKCPRFFAEVLDKLPESQRAEFYREARLRLFVPRLRYWIAKAQGITEETAAKYQKKYRKKHPKGAGPK